MAVDTGDGWILHCGDAFYHRGSIDGTRVPASVRLHEVLSTYNWAPLRDNRARLAELYKRGDRNLVLICSHDAGRYDHPSWGWRPSSSSSVSAAIIEAEIAAGNPP